MLNAGVELERECDHRQSSGKSHVFIEGEKKEAYTLKNNKSPYYNFAIIMSLSFGPAKGSYAATLKVSGATEV
jgi:hypothetical protein